MSRKLQICFHSANGKTYCWDADNHVFIEFVEKEVTLQELPDDVVAAVMARMEVSA